MIQNNIIQHLIFWEAFTMTAGPLKGIYSQAFWLRVWLGGPNRNFSQNCRKKLLADSHKKSVKSLYELESKGVRRTAHNIW